MEKWGAATFFIMCGGRGDKKKGEKGGDKWLRKVSEKTGREYNKSAGIKLGRREEKEIDATLAFI